MSEDAEMNQSRPKLIAQELDGYDSEVGAALWRLQEARGRTLRVLQETPERFINSDVEGNSIGTILYHLALIESDWLYSEILEQHPPKEVENLLPQDDRDGQGSLTKIDDESLEEHLSRLEMIRERFLEALRDVTKEDFHRARELPDYDVSPAWVLHHLVQHEAEHRAEMESVALRLQQRSGTSDHSSS